MAVKVTEVDFFAASDSTLLVRLGSPASAVLKVNEEVLALTRHLQEDPSGRILNLHPAYTTLLIRFDPLVTSHAEMKNLVRERIHTSLQRVPERKSLNVPVCYGGNFGPDLEEVARINDLTTDRVVEIHCSAEYRVYFLGFTPGFPYLGGMDPRIAVPRLASPRKAVEAGSVAIADEQTGIYPVASPGGWRVIGRTPLKLFRPDEPVPALILPGDTLRFRPITIDEYQRSHR